MRRDTLLVEPNGNAVIRFKADNPGVWLFHCHIEWHIISGLVVTFVEAPSVLQQTLEIPEDHYAACKSKNRVIPTEGNAAGRGDSNGGDPKQWLVLDGEPKPPGELHSGFTGGGIAALVMSCLAGILGVAVVAWYGFSEPVSAEPINSPAGAAGESGSSSGSGSESGVYPDADSAEKSVENSGGGLFDGAGAMKTPISVVKIKRGTEAVESEALSFGSEEEAVNAVGRGMGMARRSGGEVNKKGKKGEGVDVDAITRV